MSARWKLVDTLDVLQTCCNSSFEFKFPFWGLHPTIHEIQILLMSSLEKVIEPNVSSVRTESKASLFLNKHMKSENNCMYCDIVIVLVIGMMAQVEIQGVH